MSQWSKQRSQNQGLMGAVGSTPTRIFSDEFASSALIISLFIFHLFTLYKEINQILKNENIN